MSLTSDIVKALKAKSPQTIPSLCKATQCDNEFKLMRGIATLENDGIVSLTGFDRIYREDGGAIYLAEYGLNR